MITAMTFAVTTLTLHRLWNRPPGASYPDSFLVPMFNDNLETLKANMNNLFSCYPVGIILHLILPKGEQRQRILSVNLPGI
jgi:hypothetical protein